MEELGRTSRLARRLALATVVCCTASIGYAADPPLSESTQHQTFRNLLAEGWSSSKPAGPTRSAAAKLEISTAHEAGLPSASNPVRAELDSRTTIVRPGLRVLEVPASVLVNSEQPKHIVEYIESADAGPEIAGHQKDTTEVEALLARKEVPEAVASVPTSLAELIHRRTTPLQVPKLPNDSIAVQGEFVPSVNRLDVEQQVAATVARHKEKPAAGVQVADPIQPIQAQPQIVHPQIVHPQIAEAADREKPHVSSEDAEIETGISEQLIGDAPATSVIANSTPVEASMVEVQTPLSPAPEAPIDFPPPSRDSEVEAIAQSERSSLVAEDNGIGLLPIDSLGSNKAVELGSERDEASLTATIHATRLRELARDSLRDSLHRMQRQATHSARKYAMEALRSIVAMRDAEEGGNRHAKQLDVALDAIRESEDFCGRYGVVDQNALRRMVAVHETEVLKGRDLENVSSLEATETYLAVAKQNLKAAAGGFCEASDALVLLGKIEKQMSRPGDTHAAAVAVTLQRAAIEIAPTNGQGYQELGTTLLDQGLVQQAAGALSRSVDLQPTRKGYERLLQASRRLGDVETARLCLESLRDPSILSETPVKKLSPEVFAATYKPNLSELKTARPQPPDVDTHIAEPTSVSLRTLFPFSRR